MRVAVRKRDGNRCRMPGCKNNNCLQVHHIKRWADFPSLRFVVSNCITLCRRHHDAVKGKEEDYEAVFKRLVKPDATALSPSLLILFGRYEESEDSA